MIELTSDLDALARWVLALPVDHMNLSVRAHNSLQHAGKKTVGDVVRMTSRDVLMLKRGGRKVLNELVEELREMGLELAREDAR